MRSPNKHKIEVISAKKMVELSKDEGMIFQSLIIGSLGSAAGSGPHLDATPCRDDRSGERRLAIVFHAGERRLPLGIIILPDDHYWKHVHPVEVEEAEELKELKEKGN